MAALLRRVAGEGGFSTVLKKGDADRGSILIFLSDKGVHRMCLERVLHVDGTYQWRPIGPTESASSIEIADFLAARARFDEDFWAIELDIADPERFIAETNTAG